MLPNIGSKKTNSCDCPACSGLDCLERPRFFAGQLLTETELNHAQSYALAKNRLHNRYLHGSGVVCGLQVTCHDCEGWVTVHPGYALDPCGNDVVVCEGHDFDLIEAIRACRQEKRRERECDPWREPFREQCDDVEETWCITIRYREREAQPTTSLVSSSASSCGCNGGESRRKNERTTTVTSCEPTRVIESYELGVIPAPDSENDDDDESIATQLLASLQALGVSVPAEAIQACISTLQAFGRRWQRVSEMLEESAFTNRMTIHRDLCRLRDDLRDYLLDEPRLTCALVDRLGRVAWPRPPEQDDGMPAFTAGVTQALNQIQNILFVALIDCICYHALPGCPGDVCEDRLILACVTVRGDRILRICHTDGRRYALTTHNALLVLLNLFMDDLCCADLGRERTFAPQPGVAGVAQPVAGFAARSRPLAAAAELFSAATVLRREEAVQARVDADNLVGQPAATVRATLEEQAPLVEEVAVDWTVSEAVARNLARPFVRADRPVRLYVDERGTVVGVEQMPDEERLRRDLDAANERITRLEEQLNRMGNSDG